MDLHPGEQTLFAGHPSWRSTLLFYIGAAAAAAVVGFVVSLVSDAGPGVGVGVAILVVGLAVGYLRRLGTTYIVTNERLHIRRGLLSKRVQETRIDRVQNVNTDQSIFQRLLQIGTVDFDTAGTDDSDFTFAGVAQPEQVVQAVDKATRAGTESAAAPAAAPPPSTA